MLLTGNITEPDFRCVTHFNFLFFAELFKIEFRMKYALFAVGMAAVLCWIIIGNYPALIYYWCVLMASVSFLHTRKSIKLTVTCRILFSSGIYVL